MTRIALVALAVVVGCASREFSSPRGVVVPRPPTANCSVVEWSGRPGLPVAGDLELVGRERAWEISCISEDIGSYYGAVVLENTEEAMDVRERVASGIADDVMGESEWREASLSGSAAIEQRVPYRMGNPHVRVLRYVQRGTTLYYASVSVPVSKGPAHEADAIAWLDAVRFTDLEPPR